MVTLNDKFCTRGSTLMNTKTNYTHKELTHRSTAQLIAIYNRLFNTNIWDEMFNPFEARQEILMALF